jgi:superfamily II DNA or RNA helicase
MWRDLYDDFGDIVQQKQTRVGNKFKSRITFASVQTLFRLERLRSEFPDPREICLIIIDEGHHFVQANKTYSNIVNYFLEGNPACRVASVTATPDRSDEQALGQSFEAVAFEYQLYSPNGGPSAINDGWLVPIEQETVFVEDLQLDAVGVSCGDFIDSQLEQEMLKEKPLHRVTEATWDISGGKSTIVFTAGVEQAVRTSEIFCRKQSGSSYAIVSRVPDDGKEYPWCVLSSDKDRRRRLFNSFRKGEFSQLVNVGVCLDSETEILTSSGFIGMDSITDQHLIANWDQGEAWFEKPISLIKRDRLPEEKMVSLDTGRRSIRVTEDHDLLYRTFRDGDFKKKTAKQLSGLSVELPVSGVAVPFNVKPVQETRKVTPSKIRSLSYELRKRGLGKTEAKAEAIRRVEYLASFKYSNPPELTLEECELIGFWVGDGTSSRLKTGGIEYKLFQPNKNPAIIDRVNHLLDKCGIDKIERNKKSGTFKADGHSWSLPRGTGSGPQARRGVYRLEPYLKKSGSELYWGFSNEQFDCFLYGWWMANGTDHKNSIRPEGDSFYVCGANKQLFDLIQAIACCRGYRASVHDSFNGENSRRLNQICLKKTKIHKTTKGHSLQVEDNWKSEKVWCVSTQSKNIITRRRGTVTVMGNCVEGFDAPITQYIALGRPTKSRSVVAQQIGRGTRVLPNVIEGKNENGDWWRLGTPEERRSAIEQSGKKTMTAIDFVGNTRHSLVSAIDILGGNMPDEVVARANENAKDGNGPKNAVEALEKAEEELEAERQKREMARLALDADKRKMIEAKVAYTRQKVDVFHVLHVHAIREPEWHRNRKPSQKMIDALGHYGVKPEEMSKMSFTMAAATLDRIGQRRKEKLCTYKQAKVIAKAGIDPDRISFTHASALIDKLANNKWKPLAPSEVLGIINSK